MLKSLNVTTQVSYLGHLIQEGIVTPDTEKIQVILLWPKPTSLTTLRAFLGITEFYRKFIRGYATLASPLTDLLRLSNFTWTTATQEAFVQLKNILTTMPLLHLQNFSLPFVVETNASNVAIGAVLSRKGHPLAFFSKKLCQKMQNSLVYVREMLAITEAVKECCHYLIGTHFKIITDQQSLKGLFTNVCNTPEQQKWATKLLGYSFEIIYRPGRHNQAADFLSRPPSSFFLAESSQNYIIITH